jgi:ATP-binding protein involved in chromosome partitioning|uniref:Iron-sulfur cluster carrier protein n=1 Tax=Mesoaciditoga lauensis TaxID=1495039 RepID=A0A7V3RDN2_9BACT
MKTLMVTSGKGGVGKSTVAVNVAVDMALSGYKVGLIDVDIHGPNDHIILGVEPEIMTDGTHFIPMEIGTLKFMTIASGVGEDKAVIWRGPLKAKLIDQFVKDTEWGELDYMIMDFPPGSGDEPLEILSIFNNKVDGALVVTTPQKVALGDVEKVINFLKKMNVPIIGIWENMSYYICPHCGKKHFLFGHGTDALAEKTGVGIIARTPLVDEIGQQNGISKLFLTRSEGELRLDFEKSVEFVMKQLG